MAYLSRIVESQTDQSMDSLMEAGIVKRLTRLSRHRVNPLVFFFCRNFPKTTFGNIQCLRV